jgi:hypothetical protein
MSIATVVTAATWSGLLGLILPEQPAVGGFWVERQGVQMSDEGHRLKIERFFECFNQRDFDGMREVVHDDFVQEWPQSRERIRGLANQQAVLANYPGLPDIDVKKVHGSQDRWLSTPSYTLLRVTGTGGQYTTEQLVNYPNGEQWHAVGIFEFREGKVAKLTNYFAAPFPAAEWRSGWVETMEETPPLTKG